MFAVGPSEAVGARRSNREAVWTEWTEAKPGHGARGVGGGADGFIIGGGDPLMSIHGIKDNGGAAEQGPCRRKREKKKTGARNDLHAAVRVVAFGRSTGGSRGLISSNQAAQKSQQHHPGLDVCCCERASFSSTSGKEGVTEI